jgi:hypothetical protein
MEAGAKSTTGTHIDRAPAVILRVPSDARGRSLLLHRAAGALARTRASSAVGVGDAGFVALLGPVAGRQSFVVAINRRSRPFQAVFPGLGSGRGGGRQGEGR